MKLKSIYICTQCQEESSKWAGQCSNCHAWNTLVEDVINIGKTPKKLSIEISKPVVSIQSILTEKNRILTKIDELDRVLGGGLMSDSLILLTGHPGIGKSTLTLQICHQMAQLNKKVLYFSGEESTDQIYSRAKRLSINSPIQLLNTNDLEVILLSIEKEKPDFVVIDSVQVMASAELPSQAGSISQVRYVAEQLMQVAKQKNIPVLLIGHVNKDGHLAGPQVLTHLVDTVLYLEGDRYQDYRMLRSTKNRFGAVDEVGIFQMKSEGLIEVSNPSALFLEGRAKEAIGSAIVPILEGTRVFLVEVQALTTHTNFGYPKRTASGIDMNRLHIIIAILERYAKIKLDSSDVFVNVVGGLKLKEPAVDLAIALAIVSSKLKKPIPADLTIMGEMGLSGEIRRVTQAEKRLKEVEKLGFKKMILPDLKAAAKLELNKVKTIAEAIQAIEVRQ